MNDHDRDIILDLLEGQLSESDAVSLRARMTDDPALAAEYRTQMAVRDALVAASPVSMTSAERSSLRSSLTSQLHLTGTAAPVTEPARSGRRLWWAPLAGLAAAAAAVTVFVVLPSSSDDGATDSAFAPTAEQPTQTLPTEDAGAGVESDGEEPLELYAEGETVLVVDLTDSTPEELLQFTVGRSAPEDIQNRLETAGYGGDLFIDGSTLESCLTVLRDKLPEGTTSVHLLGASDASGRTTVYLGLTGAAGDVDTVVSLQLPDCSFTSTSGLGVIDD